MPLRRIIPLFVLILAVSFSAQAQDYRDGLQAFRAGESQKAFDIWKPLAEAGDPLAQFGLAVIYEKGSATIPQDWDAAAKWYEQATVQGVPAAQNNLGHMYSQGLGVRRDKARAVELWLEAAKGGHVYSYYNLGLAYYRGEGVEKDEAEAAKWFGQAADAGLDDGQFAIGEMYRLGIGTERNESRALGWYNLAAAQGHPMGQRLAAMLQEKGVRPSVVSSGNATTATNQGLGAFPAPQSAGSPSTSSSASGSSAAATAAPAPQVESVAPAPSRVEIQPRNAQQQAARVPAPAPQAAPQVALNPAPTPAPAQTSTGQAPAAQTQTARVPPQNNGVAGTPKGVHIWLASMKSSDEAEDHWKEVKDQHASVLGGLSPLFTKVDLGTRGTYYRVMVGPIDNRDLAQNLCQQMRSNDPAAFCKVLVR